MVRVKYLNNDNKKMTGGGNVKPGIPPTSTGQMSMSLIGGARRLRYKLNTNPSGFSMVNFRQFDGTLTKG
tara:strand:+ start:127 stop:336 length:210 start_codon:yes stop_codon:yes gene_type:complete